MKKIIITLALSALAATSAFAQFSVGAGYLNVTNKTTIVNTSSTSNFNGFYVGGDYTVELGGDDLVMIPGVYYAMASNKSNLATTTIQSLAIPIHFAYNVEISDMISIFPFAGPQMNIGLSSVTKTEIAGAQISIENYTEDSELNRINIALAAGLGIDLMETIRLKFAYNWGLLDLNKDEDIKLTNTNWQIGVAFLF